MSARVLYKYLSWWIPLLFMMKNRFFRKLNTKSIIATHKKLNRLWMLTKSHPITTVWHTAANVIRYQYSCFCETSQVVCYSRRYLINAYYNLILPFGLSVPMFCLLWLYFLLVSLHSFAYFFLLCRTFVLCRFLCLFISRFKVVSCKQLGL